nr:MAG: putative maturation protein [Leviviridae sp.]
MADLRTRTRTGAVVTGFATRTIFGGSTVYRSFQPLSESCIDVVGNRGGDNPFTLTRVTKQELCLNSSFPGGSGTLYWATDYPVGYPQCNGHNPPSTTVPPDAISIADALAKSNPSRPYVDLPILVAELKDLPRMIKGIGDFLSGKTYSRPSNIPASIGNDYLAGTFGWLPLISDLRKLLEFQTEFDKRVKELQKLSESGLHRKITVWEDEVNAQLSNNIVLTSLNGNVTRGNIFRSTTRHRWISVRWVANPITWEHDVDKHELARSLVLGTNFSVSQIWELMPWSWLIDWFSNVGDLFAAYRGNHIATPQSICIMQTTTSKEWVEITSSQANLSPRAGEGERVDKTRLPASAPAVNAYLPLLTGKQVSILSALAVTRIGR